ITKEEAMVSRSLFSPFQVTCVLPITASVYYLATGVPISSNSGSDSSSLVPGPGSSSFAGRGGAFGGGPGGGGGATDATAFLGRGLVRPLAPAGAGLLAA